MSNKNSSDAIGNRTYDLRACSAVPQPTASPRTPILTHRNVKEEELSQLLRQENPKYLIPQ